MFHDIQVLFSAVHQLSSLNPVLLVITFPFMYVLGIMIDTVSSLSSIIHYTSVRGIGSSGVDIVPTFTQASIRPLFTPHMPGELADHGYQVPQL
jgi:hypothetical protein